MSRNSYRKTLLAAAIATALTTAVTAPRTSIAQSADATLKGRASAGAEVTARNVATGVTRRTTAGADGSYAIPGLQPGTYKIDAGAGTETTVTLTVASTANVDLTAAPAEEVTGSLTEITVKSKRIVDTRTSEVGNTVSLQQIETVPQITRNFLEFADTVPGMIFSVNSSGQTSLTSGAQNSSAVNVYIDGVGQKNYVKEGGVSGQFFTQGNPFPQLAVGEYKVITSNYKAEYDQVSSAAVVAETKSGTNEFHGETYLQYTSGSLRAEQPVEKTAGVKTPSNTKEFGASLGGPIIQDKLHFFVTYEGKRYNTPVSVTPGVALLDGTPIQQLLPASADAQLGPEGIPFKEDQFFGKLDFEPTDSDRFEFSAKVRNENQAENIGVGQALSASITVLNYDDRYALHWQHSADHWFNDLLFAYEDAFNRPHALGIGNGTNYQIEEENNANVLQTGPADSGATQNKGQRGPSIEENFTFNDLHWLGDHTLKMGAKYKRVDLTAADGADENPAFYYNVTPAGTDALPYQVQFPSPVPGLSPTAHSRDHQFGVYFQDDWQQNEHLTWFLGARWDLELNKGYLDYVTPANVVAALNTQDPNAPTGQTYAQTLAKGGVNVNDFISTGDNRKPVYTEFQPRLGFSVDINADQKHVVFGGYGRSYDRDLYDYMQLEVTTQALPSYTYYFPNANAPAGNGGCYGTPCIAWNPAYLNGLSNLQALTKGSNLGSEVDLLNNDLKVPYSDQFSIGMRNQLGDWNTSATIARVISKNGFVFTLGNRYPDGSFWMNGGQPWGNGVPGFGSLIIGTNGIETKSTELLLSAEKPYTAESKWGITFAYTYTDAIQNRDATQHYAFDEENISQYPFITSNVAPRHRFVTSGSLGLPWDFVFAAKLTLATPTPVDDIAFLGVEPGGAGDMPTSATPKNFFGYRSLDVQLTKNINIFGYANAYIRLDGLNIFNWYNYDPTATINNWAGPNGGPNTTGPLVQYNYANGNITGVTRTLKLMIGAKF
ncbi:MAG TPA: TonB-dependent receptor [Steroidobacteraceae bacterium]